VTVRVRRARADDLLDLLGLFHELDRLQRDWRVFTPRPGVSDAVVESYRDALERADALVAVADDGREIVGMVFAEPRTPSRFSDERSLEVSGLVVRVDRRREGIGHLLMREAVRFAREHRISWVTVKTFSPNRAATEFWEGLGFTPRVVELAVPVDDLGKRVSSG
jgi:ribosomal protein S18 acetylase RimI-like enzyme